MFCVGASGESPPNARANALQLPPSTSSPNRELPKRSSPPPLKVCLPFAQVIESVYVNSGVISEILPLKRPPGASELRLGCPPQTQMVGTFVMGFSPNCGRTGIPCTLGMNAFASLLVAGFASPCWVLVPVLRIPKRNSYTSVGESVEVKLAVMTWGSRCDMPSQPVGQMRCA